MEIFIIIVIAVVFFIIILLYIINYKKYKWINIKLNKGEKAIKETLQEKCILLDDFITNLKNTTTINKNEFLNNITYNKTVSINDLNDITNKVNIEIEKCLEENEKLLKEKNVKEILKQLSNNNIKLDGLIKYYNKNAFDYNQLLKLFPSNIIGKTLKYKEKDLIKEKREKQLKIFNE